MIPSAHHRYWLLQSIVPDACRLAVGFRLRGPLAVEALRTALAAVHARRPRFDQAFVDREGRPSAVPAPAPGPCIAITDAGLAPERRATATAEWFAGLVQQPMDPARGGLLQLAILRFAREDHALALVMHRLVGDRHDLQEVLDALGGAADTPSTAVSGDAASTPDGDAGAEEARLAYWRQRLDAPPPVLDLPGGEGVGEGERWIPIPRPTVERLSALAAGHGCTLAGVVQAVAAALLQRCLGVERVAIAAPLADRDGVMAAPATDLAPLLLDCSAEHTIASLLAQVREQRAAAEAHPLPYARLVEQFAARRIAARPPLCQLVAGQATGYGIRMYGIHATCIGIHDLEPGFDLGLWLRVDDGADRLGIRHQRALLGDVAAGRLLGQFGTLLEVAAADPAAAIGDLPLLAAGESQRILVDWNRTATPYPRERCIHQLFAEVAAATPTAVAIAWGDDLVTYAQLDRLANRWAHALRRAGVEPGAMVGICVERSPRTVIGLLAILKAGAAYVPLDPANPADRVAFTVADAGVRVVLAEASTRACLPAEVACLDLGDETACGADDSDPAATCAAGRPAYVMYTSGTTGNPKGVVVPHRGVVRLVRGAGYADFSPDQVFLHLAPLAFDASTFEIWGPLLNGGRLAILPGRMPSLIDLGAALRTHRVTTLWLTAGLFQAMVDERLEDLAGLRQLLAGGDVLSVPHVRRVLAALPGTTLINGYGPTECTTFACCHAVVAGDGPVPIGRPIGNTTAYILDRRLQPVPVGVAGELHIGGDGVALGYLGHPELTAERFIADPFAAAPGGRLYRTGDLARYRDDGIIEFIGRRDQQLKIRGFRIEPGEIEAELARHPGVKEAAVVCRVTPAGDKRLVAHVVPAAAVTADDLRRHCQQRLPEHMVPAAIALLAALPLTANGKLDRRALALRADHDAPAREEYRAPASELEVAIAGIWGTVLATARIGLHDNFFDLGGHSLHLARIHGRIVSLIGRHLPITDLFQHPTISALARHLSVAAPTALSGAINERASRQRDAYLRQRAARRGR